MHVERSPDVSLPSEGGLAAQGMDQFSASAVCLDRSSVLSSPPAFFLDLFAGARSPVFAALRAQGADCIEPIDKINGDHHDILADDVFEAVLRLASSTLVKVSLCAPYCSKHSRATLFPGGPLPVRTPAEPEGCASNTFEQDCALQDSAAVHDRSRHVSDMVMVHGGVATLENPARSMTWLDPHMSEWVRQQTPYIAVAAACQYGADWEKSWMFVSNHSGIHGVAAACDHPAGSHERIGGKRLPDGSFYSRLTAAYPEALAMKLAECFLPYVSKTGRLVLLTDWIQSLPRSPSTTFASSMGRIEDGGSLHSSARWDPALHPDVLGQLRKVWLQRLLSTNTMSKIISALQNPSKKAPISADELNPFLLDMQKVFKVPDVEWAELVRVPQGQPFRLRLWAHILQLWGDPDASLCAELESGVRLGVAEPLQPSPIWPIQQQVTTMSDSLSVHYGEWAGAQEHPEIVEQLLQEELAEGWICEVHGGVDELKRQYDLVAVGKLNVVLAPGRSPRLVVDSSVSGVTDATMIPNRMCLPRITDVIAASPDVPSQQDITGLALDIAKAHRRVLIHPLDGGLLAFHFQGKLFRSVTLNFGARASGYYWGRVAAMLVRTLHRCVYVPHCMWIYVDDILTALDRKTAPAYASIIVLMCMCLGVPMSWAKAQLQQHICWIGWKISFEHWTITLTDEKRTGIVRDIQEAMRTQKLSVKLLERVIGRLLWVTSAWHQLRPLLNPLYRLLSSHVSTMMSLSLQEWQSLLVAMDDTCVVVAAVNHPGIHVGMRVFRAGNHNISSKSNALALHFKSRRVWIGVSDPACTWRKLSTEVRHCFNAWIQLLRSTSLIYSMLPRPWIQCQAAADAMASENHAGIGGYVCFPSGFCGWFQMRLYPADFHDVAPWLTGSLQHHICTFELLGQCLLLMLTYQLLGRCRQHCSMMTACDNTASEVAATKGLSSSVGISHVLPNFFRLQLLWNIFQHVRHIPGYRNVTADALSRFEYHGLPVEQQHSLDWTCFFHSVGLQVQPASFSVERSFAFDD